MTKDTLFTDWEAPRGAFLFDEKTAGVFEDMLERSVPLYAEIQRLIVELAGMFVVDESNVYDIGCSTGTTLVNLARNIEKQDVGLVCIDSSVAMLEKARRKNDLADRCVFLNTDLNQGVAIENASVVVMSLTLQFVHPANRGFLVSQIHDGLRENGCLILVEKIISDDPQLQNGFEKFYDDFKRRNQYSEEEITRKKEALDGVLVPLTYTQNISLLQENGFTLVEGFFRWHNFCGIIAVKRGA